MKYLKYIKQPLWILTGFFLLAYLLRNQTVDLSQIISTIQIPWVIIIIILSLAVYVIAGISFGFFIRAYIPNCPFSQSIKIIFLSLLVENLTISAVGKATQVYLTRKVVSNWEQAICCIGFDFINFQLVTLSFSILPFFDYLFNRLYYFAYTPAALGLIFDFIPIATIALLLYIPKITKPFFRLEAYICTHFQNHKAKQCHKIFHTLKTQRHILENPKRIILVITTNYLRLLTHYSLPIFAILALQIPLTPILALHVFLAEIFVELMISIVPITGKHGIAESVFMLIFTPLFPHENIIAVMILWRLSTYYFPTIFAIIIFVCSPDMKWKMLFKT